MSHWRRRDGNVGFAVGRSRPVDTAQPGDFELSASTIGSLVGRTMWRWSERVSRDDLLPICSLAFTTRSLGSHKLLKLNIFSALTMNLTDH